LLAVHCGPDVTSQGAEHVAVYASSEWAERAFCKACGTHLYYKLLATAGVFESTDFELVSQIYVDKKPDYYSLANKTTMLTEQQVIDQYASPGGNTAA
jgi:hypothetical protein